eukprot:COSAG01_NODE_2633_length_7333_cov_89.156760_9_plen_176_part_00
MHWVRQGGAWPEGQLAPLRTGARSGGQDQKPEARDAAAAATGDAPAPEPEAPEAFQASVVRLCAVNQGNQVLMLDSRHQLWLCDHCYVDSLLSASCVTAIRTVQLYIVSSVFTDGWARNCYARASWQLTRTTEFSGAQQSVRLCLASDMPSDSLSIFVLLPPVPVRWSTRVRLRS